jgi:carbon monoxide dehydrogenase subunit G
MRKRSMARACVIAVVVAAMAGCGDDGEEAEETVRDTATSVANRVEGATRLKATLTGATEVPTPGDPDATGTATVNLDVTKREACYEVTVQRIDRPVAMHIHEAEAGKSGGVVVPMTTPTASDTTTTGCTNVDAAVMTRLAADPDNFYVNVHTQAFPQGAARGQLSQ